MDKRLLFDQFDFLLDEYHSIDTNNDVVFSNQQVKSYKSSINLFSNLLDTRGSGVLELQLVCNHLKHLVINRVGTSFFEVKDPKISLKKILVSSYVKQYISVFDFPRITALDYPYIVKNDSNIIPYFKEYLKTSYQKKLIEYIERVDPSKRPQKDRLGMVKTDHSLSSSVPSNNAIQHLNSTVAKILLNSSPVEVKYFPTFFEKPLLLSNDFIQRINSGKCEFEPEVKQITSDFQVDQLLLLLYDVLNQMTSSPKFNEPSDEEIEERKILYIKNGKKAPIRHGYSQLLPFSHGGKADNNYGLKYLDYNMGPVLNVDLLFPEIFYQFGNLDNLRKYLIKKIDEIFTPTGLEKEIDNKHVSTTKPISLKQIALKWFYTNRQITRKNATEIARQYGHTSGEKLYHEYSKFSSNSNRINSEDTPKKLTNKLRLLEEVKDLLEKENENTDQVADEIKVLKAKRKNTFEDFDEN